MTLQDRITVDERVVAGKAAIRGTRLTVEFVLGLLAAGWSQTDIIREYIITKEDILACLEYARDRVAEERVYPLAR
jgi:uncharacterized protein (DUF433 family)